MDGFELPPRKKLSEFLNQEAAAKKGKGKNVFASSESRTPRKDADVCHSDTKRPTSQRALGGAIFLARLLSDYRRKVFEADKISTSARLLVGKCWTEEEHRAFLAGLTKLGKGNWTGIARFYVPTRTSTQIASHAQKYMQRMTGATKRKSRFSDIEQQVQASGLAEEMQPTGSLPDYLLARHKPHPTPAGGDEAEECDSLGREESHGRAPKQRRICRPIANDAISSEPDLVNLAESLISLSDPSRSTLASNYSAFQHSDSIQAQ